jgi:hypothetical protein
VTHGMPACPAERRSGASRLPWMRRGQSRTAAAVLLAGIASRGPAHHAPPASPAARLAPAEAPRPAAHARGASRGRMSYWPRRIEPRKHRSASPAQQWHAAHRLHEHVAGQEIGRLLAGPKRVAGDRRAVYSGTLPPTVVRILKPLVDNVSNAPGRPPITLSGQSCPCRMLFAGISPRRKSPLGVRGSR